MPKIDEGRIRKLPKWAQRHILFLQRECDDAKAMMQAMAGEPDSSDIFWHDMRNKGGFVIPEKAIVEFRLRNKKGSKWVRVHVRENVMHIAGDYAYSVLPSASNRISIELRD